MERREEEVKEDFIIGKYIEEIPLDLIYDILLRLPVKSVVRSRSVSKLWSSITTRPDFMRSFPNQSSTRLCLLASIKTKDDTRLFISLPQQKHPNTSYLYVDCFKKNIPPFNNYGLHPMSESVHGLVMFYGGDEKILVLNPSMRQHVTLPLPKPKINFPRCCLGHDPVEDKYKVLLIYDRGRWKDPVVFTLGRPQESWRVIQNSPWHCPTPGMGRIGTCINGHVYYQAVLRFKVNNTYEFEEILMSFDVRYEKFHMIKMPPAEALFKNCLHNYEGKLALLCSFSSGHNAIEFWVLEDREKQEWSFRRFLLLFLCYPQPDPIFDIIMQPWGFIQDTGEFIFIKSKVDTIYVLYYDPKRKRARRIIYESDDINGIEDIDWFPNYYESLMSLHNTN